MIMPVDSRVRKRTWIVPLAAFFGLLAGGVVTAPFAAATALICSLTLPDHCILDTTDVTLPLQGAGHHYLLQVPPTNTTEARPLLIALHGFLGTGQSLARDSGLSAAARLQNLVVAYPDGDWRSWGTAPTDDRWSADLALLQAVVQDASARVRIDQQRIYVVGFSAGGFMAQALACSGSLPLAGVAVIASNLFDTAAGSCAKPRAVPFLLIHGTADPVVPYEGGSTWRGQMLSVPRTLDFWATANGCKGGLTESDSTSADPLVPVRRRAATSCRPGGAAEAVLLVGGGHDWPGGNMGLPGFLAGRASSAVNASRLAMDFLLRRSRRDMPGNTLASN